MPESVVETPRLTIRRLAIADVEDLQAVYGDRDSMRWVDDGEPLDRAGCVHWVRVTQANYVKYGYGMFALVHRKSGVVVGFCGIVHPGGQPEPEIKYALKRDFWGQGLATEAVGAILGWGAREFGLSEIKATVAPGNTASQRVLEKSGMRHASDRLDDGTITRVYAWRSEDSTSGRRTDHPA